MGKRASPKLAMNEQGSLGVDLGHVARTLCRFERTPLHPALLALFCVLASVRAAESGATATWDYLGDHPELVAVSTQDWGELGWNTAAHAGGVAPLPIKLGEQVFPRGLGHHANGGITVAMGGAYAEFHASLGVQAQATPNGSVVFRVLVDGEERYRSPVVKQADGAVPIRVDVRGGEELQLEALDAGDGITCDMATWADARLLRSQTAASSQAMAVERVNVAPFARVATWDPRRKDGARAKRTEEFLADDLYLDTDVPRDPRGVYRAGSWPGGQACIGLQWLNRRSLSELTLELAAPLGQDRAGGVRCEFWTGESAWQGEWKPVEGKIDSGDLGATLRIDLAARTLVTQKIRWILPCGPEGARVSGFVARTRSRWSACELSVEMGGERSSKSATLEIYNGVWLDQAELTRRVAAGRGVDLGVRYCKYSANNADATSIRFGFASGTGFAVAVADVLKAGYVYVPDAGVLVRTRTNRVSIAEAAAIAAKGRTVRAEVAAMPDQTLTQAMARTHHEAQHEGPVMLSLGAHNAKWVVESRGDIWFPADSKDEADYFQRAGLVRIEAGSGNGTRARRLLDGWLPVPIQSLEDAGLRYTQTVCVGPARETKGFVEGITARAVGLATFDLTNTTDKVLKARWAWTFLESGHAGTPGRVEARGSGFGVYRGGRLVGSLGLIGDNAGGLRLGGEGNRCELQGDLAPHASARCALWLYPSDTPLDGEIQKLTPDLVLDRTARYWKDVLGGGMEISTPERFLNDAIRSSVAHCMIVARQEADGARVAPWIAAVSYGPLESEAHSVVRAMSYFGQVEFARRGLDFFVHRYLPSGMLTTGYTTFGTEWHLWTLAEHVLLHDDSPWLRARREAVASAGDWIRRQLEKGRTRGAVLSKRPEAGLMPPGVLADWNAYAYHFCMSAYAYAGLEGLASSFRMLNDSRAGAYAKAARRLREDLLRAYRWTRNRAPVLPLRSSEWIPAYPSQVHSPGPLGDFFPGQDAGRSWCYDVELGAHQLVPTGVLAPDAPETTRLLDHMEDVQFLADGWFDYTSASNRQDWFNLGGFSKVQPYYTRNAEIYAMRGEAKPFVRSYFNSLAAMINPEIMTFWEHFRHSGAWDKTHETGYFLHQTRAMFVMERGSDLELAPLTPDYWLAPGRGFSVDRAPTRFGTVSFSCARTASGDRVRWRITPPPRLGRGGALLLRMRLPAGAAVGRAEIREGRGVAVSEAGPGLLRLATKGGAGVIELEIPMVRREAAGPAPAAPGVLENPECMGVR